MKPHTRIISAISAVLLIAFLSTQALAVGTGSSSSNWTTATVSLDTKLDGQAMFTTEKNHTALYSAKLVLPENATEGSAAYALYAYNKPLSMIDSLSFYVAYNQALPRLFITLDKDNDTAIDSILLSDYKNASNGEWKSISADYCNGWTESNYEMTNYGVNWTSLEYWQNQYPNATAKSIGVCLEYWAVEPEGFGQAVYTDKMILNGVYHTVVPITTPEPTTTPTPSPKPTKCPNATATPAPECTPQPTPTLTLTCSSSLDQQKFRVDIQGALTGNGTGISGASISIFYSLSGGSSWNELTYVTTEEDGTFSALWFPTVTGNFLVKAKFAGNCEYSQVKTVVNLAVTPADQQENVFSVSSNSTISQLAFNSTTNELSCGVSGEDGTTGYVDVFIPKSLIADISSLIVYIDDQQINYTSTSLDDSWVLHLAYHHSEHKVTLSLNSLAAVTDQTSPTIAENGLPYPTVVAVAFVVALVAAVTMLAKRAMAKHS